MIHPIGDPWFYAFAIPAVLLTGISKGGFGSGAGNLAVPAMAQVVPATLAASIVLPILSAMDIVGIWAWRGRWDLPQVLRLLPGGMAGILLGALSFRFLSERAVTALVGAIALGFALWSILQAWRAGGEQRRAEPSLVKGAFWSAVSGFTSTLAHAGGPPLAVYMLPLRMDRATLSATTILFFGATNGMKFAAYIANGQLSAASLATTLMLLPLAPIGIRLGIWLQRRVSERLFYRIVYAMLLATGVKLLYDAALG